jgi:hypothetical protein
VSSGGGLVPSTRISTNALRTDWLFLFRPGPGTVFFLGYGGVSANRTVGVSAAQAGERFFHQGSYVLRIPIV